MDISAEAAEKTARMVCEECDCIDVFERRTITDGIVQLDFVKAKGEALNKIERRFGNEIKLAVCSFLNTESLAIACYHDKVRASIMVRKGMDVHGVELMPWFISEKKDVPRIIAESDVRAIEAGYDGYIAVIVVKSVHEVVRVGILKSPVDRKFRVCFFPNKNLPEMTEEILRQIAVATGGKRATYIGDSTHSNFVAIDDPVSSVADIEGMFGDARQHAWCEIVYKNN